MRSSCEASATNSRWRASAPSVSARASPSEASMASSVWASSATSSSASVAGIFSVGSRDCSIRRAAAVSSVIGSMARRATARPASRASRAPPRTPKARKTLTRLAVSWTSEIGFAYWSDHGSPLTSTWRVSTRQPSISAVRASGGPKSGAVGLA